MWIIGVILGIALIWFLYRVLRFIIELLTGKHNIVFGDREKTQVRRSFRDGFVQTIKHIPFIFK